jgi:hypothetical protein
VGAIRHNIHDRVDLIVRRGARAVALHFVWVAFPREVPERLAPFASGGEPADALLLSSGLWSLTFDGPTAAAGAVQAVAEWPPAVRAIAAAADAPGARGALRSRLVWRSTYVTEIDGHIVNRTGDRYVVPRAAVDAINEAGAREWAAAGFRTWNVTAYTDVRIGGVARAHNEFVVTDDGYHLHYDADVELAWEFLSHASDVVAEGRARAR